MRYRHIRSYAEASSHTRDAYQWFRLTEIKLTFLGSTTLRVG